MAEALQELLQIIRGQACPYVIGIDEVGLGAWAGPVTVAGCLVRHDWVDARVKDSKAYQTFEEREALVRDVLTWPEFPSVVAHASVECIDRVGVQEAIRLMMLYVAQQLREKYPEALVVVDGNRLPAGLSRAQCLPKADALIPAVSAASVLAKVDRDDYMRQLALEHPGYGFARNVGYGTQEHRDGLESLGVCPIHRKSYAPIRKLLERGYT